VCEAALVWSFPVCLGPDVLLSAVPLTCTCRTCCGNSHKDLPPSCRVKVVSWPLKTLVGPDCWDGRPGRVGDEFQVTTQVVASPGLLVPRPGQSIAARSALKKSWAFNSSFSWSTSRFQAWALCQALCWDPQRVLIGCASCSQSPPFSEEGREPNRQAQAERVVALLAGRHRGYLAEALEDAEESTSWVVGEGHWERRPGALRKWDILGNRTRARVEETRGVRGVGWGSSCKANNLEAACPEAPSATCLYPMASWESQNHPSPQITGIV
jgi:hypothetical protein